MRSFPKIQLLPALLLLGACSRSDDSLLTQVQASKPGDVYVVKFQPQGRSDARYYFYHVYRATPDSLYLHPARQDAARPDADLRQLAYEPSAKSLVYTRAEVLELLQEQPGDVTKSRLIQIR